MPYRRSGDRHAGHLPAERDRRGQSSRDQRRPRPTCRTRSNSRATSRWSPACASTISICSITTTAPATTCAASTTWSRRARASSSSRVTAVSIYGSYSVSYLPSSGDQFSSLTTITQQVKPEKFNNYEAGVEVGCAPVPLADHGGLPAGPHQHAIDRSERSDAHRADRQPAHQRFRSSDVNGSITRRWRVAGGYAYQDAFVTSATTAARAGRTGRAGAAPHLLALEQLPDPAEAGGRPGHPEPVDMFAAIDNTVACRATRGRMRRCTTR